MIYDVCCYGAVGDGLTDDQPAIQRAIDAASTAGGGVVYVPTGTYRVAMGQHEQNASFHLGAAARGLRFVGDGDSTLVAWVSTLSLANRCLLPPLGLARTAPTVT